MRWVRGLALIALFFTACESGTETSRYSQTQAAINRSIAQERPGNYYIGRRFFRRYFFFWGYVRKPRQSWSQAQLVMLNEQKVHAPDRAENVIGSDNGYEYRLQGYFSGQKVYEPASNSFYPEFVLTGYTLLSQHPPPIFRQASATDPNRITIDRPE